MSTTLAFDIIARDRASDSFDKVGNSAGKSTGKLKQFAKVGAMAAGAAAVVAGKALFDMTKGAIEDAKAQAILAKTLQNATGATDKQVSAVEKWISAQGEALGVTDDELRPALQRLAEATGDVGKAQELASLAMDISAGTGKSLKTVSEALAKAQMGQVGGLSRYGIATRDASGEMMKFDEVTKKAAKTFGGQAATAAETTEGKFQRLKVMFDETKESIGAKLIPVAEKVASFFLANLGPTVSKVGEWFKNNLMPPLKELAEAWLPRVKDNLEALKNAFASARPLLDLVGKIFVNVLVPALKGFYAVVGPVLVKAIEGLGLALGAIGKAGTWMWNNALQPVFKFLAEAVSKAMGLFASMLEVMGKVPGFGWADTAAEKLRAAAEKAGVLADNIKKIPPKKDVTVTVTTISRHLAAQNANNAAAGKGRNPGIGEYAIGTPYAPGGRALVGERGPELVDLPRGSRVYTAQATAAMGVSGLDAAALERAVQRGIQKGMERVTLMLEGGDAAQRAYIRSGVTI